MEFGSDFHTFDYPKVGKTLLEFYPDSNLYASGRQALLDLAIARGWERLWVPTYFCEESLECIAPAGIKLCNYYATPLSEPTEILRQISPKENDGLLIVNYFGLFGSRAFPSVGCEIVEDHTHNLIGDWALNSTADWCIASLRKTLPIADGGIFWSPKHHTLPTAPKSSDETEKVMALRAEAMTLKMKYLDGDAIDKSDFIRLFGDTEARFDQLPISAISSSARRIVEDLDIGRWYAAKRRNWEYLVSKLSDNPIFEILKPENEKDCPFSLTLKFKDKVSRDAFRSKLIEKSVYPAILWTIEDNVDKNAKQFSDTMLSVHCDGRYSLNDMQLLSSIIKDSFI